MSAHRTAVRTIVLAVAAAALSAALLAGSAAARPIHGLPLGVRLDPQVATVHQVPTDGVAPPTSALSSYRNGFAANPKVAAATGNGAGGSSDTWGAIGAGLLAAAFIGGGVVLVRRDRRREPHGTPSFGA